MKRKRHIITCVLCILSLCTSFAATHEELMGMVDSAYNEAMMGRLQQAVAINMDGLAKTPAD